MNNDKKYDELHAERNERLEKAKTSEQDFSLNLQISCKFNLAFFFKHQSECGTSL